VEIQRTVSASPVSVSFKGEGISSESVHLTRSQQYRKHESMKATFQIPDELYREVKAETAREGRTLRDVTISFFEQWLRDRKRMVTPSLPVDWRNFKAPLAHLVLEKGINHSMEAMRGNIVKNWNEPS